jgi:uncharacterized protein YkwD
MRKKYIVAIILITALLITGVTFTVLSQKSPEKPSTYATAQTVVSKPLNADTIFELVNAERIKAGLKPLVRDARLDATAQARADDMVARNYFSHNDPVTGENLSKILLQYYPEPCSSVSENIMQIKYTTPMEDNAEAVYSWMNSKKHHDAILLAEYNTTGIAVSGKNVVQHFCTR